MAHSGVFLEPQDCRFAGIAHGQKSHDFIDRLVQRRFARVEAARHLYQGRFYHLHHKRLYSLIGETDNRNRKRAHRSRMIERLMLLDIVLDEPRHPLARHGVGQGAVRPRAPRPIPHDAARTTAPDVRFRAEPGPSSIRRQAADRRRSSARSVRVHLPRHALVTAGVPVVPSAPRFGVLEKVWRLHGDDVVWNAYSKGIEDQFDIGRAAVGFIVISRQYLHLAHLVGVA